MVSISVVVTCYNEEEYIGYAIQSVLDQTRYDLVDKVVVVDDGSNDGSEEVIRKIEEENPKVKYIYQENEGLAGARNTGIGHCEGDFVALQDGDDIWVEKKIEYQAKVIEEYSDVGIVYTDFRLFGDRDKERGYPNQYKYSDGNVLERFFRKDGPIVPSTAVVNAECFSTVGMFDTKLLRAQDTDMWLRIAAKYRLHYVDEPLVARREHADSLGSDHLEKARYLMQVIDKTVSAKPRLRPFANERKAMVMATRGRKLLEERERWTAVRVLIKAVKLSPLSIEIQASLFFVLLPLPVRVLQPVLKVARKLKKYFRR